MEWRSGAGVEVERKKEYHHRGRESGEKQKREQLVAPEVS
jgi:hypothetical protein